MHKYKYGFSLLEVLIAITVFSLGILAIMQILLRNLSVVDRGMLQTSSILLAKEGIEIVYNLRDSNLEKGLPRDCVIEQGIYNRNSFDEGNQQLYSDENICAGYFGSGALDEKTFEFAFDPDNYFYTSIVELSDNFEDLFEAHRLFQWTGLENNLWHSHEPNPNPSYFARYITFEKIIDSGEYLPAEKILKITSHVLTKKGGYTGEVILESFIGNY